ncbi:MAG: AAA family ATPase [Clostridium sp.]|nr:AAA family ATPase [Clostridium sp.]
MVQKESFMGARWVRVDFHLHSPGSHTFRLPSGMDSVRDREKIVQLYVRQLKVNNVEVAAITDYNYVHAEWYNRIREVAVEHGIIVYPGVELSIDDGKRGIHILAVFPLDMHVDNINLLICSLDKKPDVPLINAKGEHRDIDPKVSVEEALAELQKRGAVLFVAHPNQDKGLLTAYAVMQAARFLNEVRPEGIESLYEIDLKRLTGTGILAEEAAKWIASVEFSDPKAIEEIGTKTRQDGKLRATYLKLSVLTDIEAINLALHDPQIRVQAGDVPTYNFTHLNSLEIDGSGFLGGLKIALSPELNTIIGGRGVGKSALLELIRYTLNLRPYAPTEYRDSLVKHALGSGGKAIVCFKQILSPTVSRSYRVERVLNENPTVFESSTEQEIGLSPNDIWNESLYPLFFGQREIYEITRNESERLRFLDEIIGRNAWQKLKELKIIEEKLRNNAQALLTSKKQLVEKEDISRRLKQIEHEIELFRQEGIVDKLKEATLLAQDEERLMQTIKNLENVRQQWHDTSDNVSTELKRMYNWMHQSKSGGKAILEQIGGDILSLDKDLQTLSGQGITKIDSLRSRINEMKQQWLNLRKTFDEEIRRIKQELGTQTLDPDDLEKITREQTKLLDQVEYYRLIELELERKENDRKQLIKDLSNLRHEVFSLRLKRADALSLKLKGRVRVAIEYRGNKAAFCKSLTAALQGSGVDSRTIIAICEQDGMDGLKLSKVILDGVAGLRTTLGISEARAQQITSWFVQHPEKLFDLELLTPTDQVKVYLQLDNRELPLEKLSDGQRATAMLLIILSLDDRIVIIDQPEDDLDNRFIYDDIVKLLRNQKGLRQIITATHNPNLPVLGDAELVVSLDAMEDKALTPGLGSIDMQSIREAIKTIMEGGEDAFRRRAAKYGWVLNK